MSLKAVLKAGQDVACCTGATVFSAIAAKVGRERLDAAVKTSLRTDDDYGAYTPSDA